LAHDVQIFFEVADVSVKGLDGKTPRITFTHEGKSQHIDCDFIGGCDGFHGICRSSIPHNKIRFFDRDYPFGWLGILSESPIVDEELIYSYHDRGFALYTQRSPMVSRLYFQCAPDEDVDNWSDEQI